MNPEEARFNVLVIDDDEASRELLEALLSGEGCRCACFASAEEALRAAQGGDRFQLAVVDVRLPGKSGFETIEALKKLDPDMEAILLTAYGSAEVAALAVKVGAFAYLTKPLNPLELRALLPNVFEKAGLKSLVGLYEATRVIFSDVRFKDLLSHLLSVGKKTLAADDVTLMVLGDDRKLRIAASSSLSEEVYKKIETPLGEGVAGRVAQWRSGVTINGPLQSDPRFADLPSRGGKQVSLIYPIVAEDRLVGILTAVRKDFQHPFQPQDLRHAAILCSQMGQAIENAKLYDRLETARQAAEQANALKDELLHITTHDLKSPLTVVKGAADMLAGLKLEPKARHYAELVAKNAKDMLELINRLLQKAKLEDAELRLDKKPVDVGAVIHGCVENVRDLAEQKGVGLAETRRLPDGYTLPADAAMLKEMAANLIGNALKFCSKGCRIEVLVERGEGDFRLSVADDGPGIPAADQARLFAKFQRGSAPTAEGSGIGLSIVKRFAELHGGRVELKSAPGRGSTFTVVLPEA